MAASELSARELRARGPRHQRGRRFEREELQRLLDASAGAAADAAADAAVEAMSVRR